MCELMGMSFSEPMRATISLNVFQDSGLENPDGWGVAYFQDKAVQLIKEASPASDSTLYDYVERNAVSKIYISHLRRSTEGIRSYLNTHPFYRIATVMGKRSEYAFAHNGTVSNFREFSNKNFHALGGTDSEHIFCHVLDTLMSMKSASWKESEFLQLHRILQGINSTGNTINCLLSDGEYLFCYSDKQDHNSGLRYSAIDTAIKLRDTDADLGQISVNLAKDIDGDEVSGFVVTTRRMSHEEWIEFNPGQLIVFRNGRVEYPSIEDST